MTAKHYASPDGIYLGAFDGATPPNGAIETPAPAAGDDTWTGAVWAPRPQTKAERIAHVLATTGKGKDRTLIQQVIQFAEMVAAPMLATQYSVTLQLAIMGLYARNKTYRECKDAETAIENIEDEP